MRQSLGLIGAAILLTSVAGCEATQNIVRFEVTFKGNPSCIAAGVDSVRVSLPDTAGVPTIVDCDSEDRAAVEIQDLEPGTYRVVVDGMKNFDSTWTDREEIVVTGGKQTFKVDLTSVTPSVLAHFKFAAPGDSADGMTCAQAEVQTVQVAIDNGTPMSVNCNNPATSTDVALIEGVAAGKHSFRFFVTDGQSRTTYEMTTQQTVQQNSSNSYNINLVPKLKGSLQIQWIFQDKPTCSAAGVNEIHYGLTKPDGTTPPALAGKADCADMNGANSYVTFGTETVGELDAGAYAVAKLEGVNSAAPGTVLYKAATPVSGVFVLPGQLKAYNVELAPK